ncbi:head GIN domain-containing protein [Aurantiacibacter luteus]|uniref:Putative auto-transporter adhesin head GIN domain-containing protein n=1 Tax=Aurantiacibacter luteus TaxID=1581420 RepID=A0A0G9MUC5_9SPHN|nr:head GIN domain-containing protein [Aurantiacibacter luteus]KLE34335.1 hypothetical protein AAW00_08825 [Aurantiacibacter luteus]
MGSTAFSIGLGAAALLSLGGCELDDAVVAGDFDGVPLARLETPAEIPQGVVLGGPDRVVVVEGTRFGVTVEGSERAKQRMRFAIDDDALVIGREDGDWRDEDYATVTVTIPAPSALVIGGSGTLTSFAVAGDADVVIGGSGSLDVARVDARELSVVIGGSGTARLAGRAEDMDIVVAGSGSADMARLAVGRAEVMVGGSGDAAFASDGTVSATIAGSGTVTVDGDADCSVESAGSGSLVCGGQAIAAR